MTSIGALTILPPLAVIRAAAVRTSRMRKSICRFGGTFALSGGLFITPSEAVTPDTAATRDRRSRTCDAVLIEGIALRARRCKAATRRDRGASASHCSPDIAGRLSESTTSCAWRLPGSTHSTRHCARSSGRTHDGPPLWCPTREDVPAVTSTARTKQQHNARARQELVLRTGTRYSHPAGLSIARHLGHQAARTHSLSHRPACPRTQER
jgi:hypothetical protein